MMMSRSSLWARVVVVAALAGSALWFGWARFGSHTKPLLLAPMINVLDPCNDMLEPPAGIGNCNRLGGSAAPLTESTLSGLGPRISPNGRFELGYTMQFPLFRLLKQQGSDWVVDLPVIKRMVDTLHEDDRRAVVCFFSTHFGVDAPIEPVLAGDVRNLAVSPAGPMRRDRFYEHDIYPCTFATTDDDLTRRRVQVIDAVVDEICRLPQRDGDKIRGVTLLGELHHPFPNFQGGMGCQEKYLVSDYSGASTAGLRAFLVTRFDSVASLNIALGSDYPSFAAVDPPSKEIRTQPLTRYTEHIDSYAHGTLPISGWLYAPTQQPAALRWIRLYRNGNFVDRVPVNLSRQDVHEAHPEFGTADVGWRFDLNFPAFARGIHRLDTILGDQPDRWVHLGTPYVSAMERNQATPIALPQKDLPPTVAPGQRCGGLSTSRWTRRRITSIRWYRCGISSGRLRS